MAGALMGKDGNVREGDISRRMIEVEMGIDQAADGFASTGLGGTTQDLAE